jgi:hypothetical protein
LLDVTGVEDSIVISKFRRKDELSSFTKAVLALPTLSGPTRTSFLELLAWPSCFTKSLRYTASMSLRRGAMFRLIISCNRSLNAYATTTVDIFAWSPSILQAYLRCFAS